MAALLALAGGDRGPGGRRRRVVDGFDDRLPSRHRHLEIKKLSLVMKGKLSMEIHRLQMSILFPDIRLLRSSLLKIKFFLKQINLSFIWDSGSHLMLCLHMIESNSMRKTSTRGGC